MHGGRDSTTTCAARAGHDGCVVVWYWRRGGTGASVISPFARACTSRRGAPLGDMYVKQNDATALVERGSRSGHHALLRGTAPWYGVGWSEACFGVALHRVPRDSFSLQTKEGRFLVL